MLHSLKLRAVTAGVAAIGAVAAIAGSAGAAPKAPNSAAPQRAHAASIASLPSAVTAARAVPQAIHDGACDEGDACLWYFSDFRGSRYDNPHNEPNLVNNRFISAGSGQLSSVTNNAETVFNQDGAATLVVCTGPNSTARAERLPPSPAAHSPRRTSTTWSRCIGLIRPTDLLRSASVTPGCGRGSPLRARMPTAKAASPGSPRSSL